MTFPLFRQIAPLLCAAAWTLVAAPVPARAGSRPIELEDLFRFQRLSDPQISPNGQQVVYVSTAVDKAENRTNADLWLTSIEGGPARKLTNSPQHDRHPRWSPDGKWIAFESSRDGEQQIWLLPTEGGEPRRLTSISSGAGQAVWSRDGKQIAFVSAVYPEYSEKPYAEADKLNRERNEAKEKGKVKARVLTHLLFRHWDAWVDDKRLHLFVVGVKDGAADGEPRDVTPGDRDAVPNSSTFSEGDDFDFSPDGAELVYTATPTPAREEAWRTNHDLYSVNLRTGERRQLTTNPAADALPRFSPDGKLLAYRAQSRPGAEADRWQLFVLDRATGRPRSLTAELDVSVEFFTWSPDGTQLFFHGEEKGVTPIFAAPVAGGKIERLTADGVSAEVNAGPDGKTLVFTRHRLTQPAEISRWRRGEEGLQAVTRANADALAEIEMSTPESVTVAGAGGTPVQMWIIKPPRFDPAKKYPLVFWVHGGPQTAFLDGWSTRWNSQVWAAQGYVIALPNPRGSTGFGQTFTDEISHDWGGKVFEDLMACLAHLEKQPYIDTQRMAAAGASYGGYMMNWFQGHTDKFKTLVTHDGVYNFQSMYGTTEEVWFDEWEHGIPWENPDFEKFSPHRFAANFKTPNLIIHNENDFRVPLSEGLQLFTLLQRKGVPSKLLYFPDEGHWVLKPQNSELWHKTIFAWLKDYLR
jgi:dipeptidyl aminopeptidase/acylaminoacyl peptidase